MSIVSLDPIVISKMELDIFLEIYIRGPPLCGRPVSSVG